MSEIKSRMESALEQEGFTRISPGESKSIFMGASKDIIQINSKKDKIYNELLDQMMDSINHDSTIMLTRRPTENMIADVMTIPGRGVKSEANTPERKAGRKSNVVVSYSDMEHDRQRIAESDKPSDKVKLKVMERISNEFDPKIREAEMKDDKLEAQNLKNKKNVAWSIVKNEIDGVKKPRKEIKRMMKRANEHTPRSTYIAGYEPWQDENAERVGQIITTVMDSADKYVDVEQYQMRSNVSTNARNPYNRDLRNFQELNKNMDKYYAYDIETIGNALNSNRFSVVEIAAQGFKRNNQGAFVMDGDDKFTALIELLPEEQKEMRQLIESLKKDKYSINKMSDYQRRSIADLMRYSTIGHSPEKLKVELMHNPIISKVYGRNEELLSEYMIHNMGTMVQHMESALTNLTYREGKENIVIKASTAQKMFNQFVQQNNSAAFVGHNSNRFDDVKLKEWHSNDAVNKFTNNINLPKNRIDFMNLIQATYPDPRELLGQLWGQRGINKGVIYEQGHTRLYELQRALGFDLGAKHSALADVADEGLGGVLARAMAVIAGDIEKGKLTSTLNGVKKNKGKILWSDTFIKEGQVLYADDGYMNYKKLEGMDPGKIDSGKVSINDLDTSKVDLSFMAKFNPETGEFERITNDFNTSIINAKSFYEVQGLYELEQGRMALRLYDKEQDKYSFIVREGEDAVDRLQDFVQRQFYDWNSYEKEAKERITQNRKTDIARRRYDKMFSLSSSDLGRTSGFQSAQRYFEALDLYEKRVAGKDSNIKKQVEGLPENLRAQEEQRLRSKRLSHEQFDKELRSKFMTLWDEKNSEWVFNEQEYKDFFEMRKRLQSERDVYTPAIEVINKEYGSELAEAKKRLDAATYGTAEFTEAKKAYGKVARQMDMAWIAYANEMDQYAENLNEKVEQKLEAHQKRQVKIMDKDRERSLNLFDYEDARASLNKYAYMGLNHIENQQTKLQMARERLIEMVVEMDRSGVITSKKMYDKIMNEISNNQVTGNAITAVAKIFGEASDKEIKFERELMVSNMGVYNPKLIVGQDRLKLLAKQHAQYARNYLSFAPAPASSKNKFKFNDQIEQLFDKLDGASRPFNLEANNRKAVENLVESIMKEAPNHTIGFSWNQETNNFTVSVVKEAMDNTIVLRELQEGKIPTGALNFNVPLIGTSGTHQIGRRVINARSYMEHDYETGGHKVKSSTEKIVEEYTKNMKVLMSQMKYSSTEHAQDTARVLLNKASNSLAGIQRNAVSFSDTNYFTNNFSDYIKQSHVDIQDVLIKQLLAGKFEGIKLEAKDFVDPTKVDKGRYKGLVTFDDLNFDVQYKTALALEKFIDENSLDLHMSGIKDDSNAGRRLAGIDVRLLGAFRDYIPQTRSNSIQAANAVVLNPDVIKKLNEISGVTTHQHVTTDLQREFLNHWNSMTDAKGNRLNEDKALSFDMKVMYMNDKDVYDRIKWMSEQEEGLKILTDEGIAYRDADGKIRFDPSAMPRVYEQQIIMNKDAADSLKTTRTKTFSNVKKFTGQMKKLMEGKLSEVTLSYFGQIIGLDSDGNQVRWEKSQNAKFTAQGNVATAEWQESLFKLLVGGEKGTINPFSERFIKYFTGRDDVVAIMNPNIEKHLDLGMPYESKAGLFSEHARKLLAEGKTSALELLNEDVKKVGLEWDVDNGQYVERVRKYFANKDLPAEEFAKIAKDHGIQTSVSIELSSLSKESLQRVSALEESVKHLEEQKAKLEKSGNSALNNVPVEAQIEQIQEEIKSKKDSIENILSANKKEFQVGILNTVASAVYDHSRATDGTGKEIIGFKDGRPIYAESKGNRGISWGHRELSALRQKGLNVTADRMLKQMIKQGYGEHYDESGKRVAHTINIQGRSGRISRIEEAHNLIESIAQMTNLEQEAKAINIMAGGDVNYLPEYRSDIHTLKNTIFDKEHILNTLGDASSSQHGYWLELPTTVENGEKYSINVNVHGVKQDGYTLKDRVKSNKIFIPFTNLEGSDGKVHFRELQKKINDIYRRAKDVETAGDGEKRGVAMGKLQEAVDSYTDRLIYDVTSSKGFIGTSVGKVRMGFQEADGAASSAYGLFKLIDPITSATELDGEHTFISESMAKKMGIYDQLKDGGHVYTMNNRFPTFHQDAMQVTKLKIGKNVAENEIHTTAFFSDLLKADSDGDYNNLVVDTSADVQAEWADLYKKEQEKYKEEVEALKNNKAMDRKFDIESLIENIQKDYANFNAGKIMDRNLAGEIAAKIGKQTIGMASNLNLQLQQVAKDYLQDDKATQEAMLRTGKLLEQKLISSKHGVTVGDGVSPAMEFINLIKRSGVSEDARKQALRYAKDKFEDIDFGDDLAKTLDGIRKAQERSSRGINNPAMRAGTSRGISPKEGLQYTLDNIMGNVEAEDMLTSNSYLNMLRHIEKNAGSLEKVPEEYRLSEEHVRAEEVVEMPESKLKRNTRQVQSTLREGLDSAQEFLGNAKNFINENPLAKKGLIGGALALGGIGLYNIASKDNPVPEMNQQSQQSPEYDNYNARPSKSALPPIEDSGNYGNSQAVNVSVSAQGSHSINKGQVGGMVSNSLNNAGVSSSGANMHITQRDNSNNLNSIWYRDKVQENI